MSWSVSFVGKPEGIVAALQEESGKLTGQCKTELDDALPHLVGLVKENFHSNPDYAPMLNLEACGSGSAAVDPVSKESRQNDRSCTVKIERWYRKIV